MQPFKSVHLYLDCDTTRQNCIRKAQEIDSSKFIDESRSYENYKDLNDWLMHRTTPKTKRLFKALAFPFH